MTAPAPRLAGLLARLRADRRGALAVEFAFVATILIACLAGMMDLIAISAMSRDIERSSTQVANLITSCSRSTDASCVSKTIDAYIARQANSLVRYPAATVQVSIAQVSEAGNTLKICLGNMTYLESDVSAAVLALLADKDNAIVVIISIAYRPFFPVITALYTGSADRTLRGWTTAVQSSGANVC
jgi:Flp pilus assembly protein TadG